MTIPQGTNPVEEWYKQALLLILGDISHYFDAARRAIQNGHPEDAFELMWELDERLCDLLGNAPNAEIVDITTPTLLRALVRCDLTIAGQWLMLCQQQPNDKQFVSTALEAAREQYVFLRDFPGYEVVADEELSNDLRMFYLKLAGMFD